MSTVTETLDNADAELAAMAKEDARRFMQSDGSQDEMGFAARRFRERDLEVRGAIRVSGLAETVDVLRARGLPVKWR